MGPGVMRWTTGRISAETTETEMPYYSGDNNANNIDYSNNTYALRQVGLPIRLGGNS